MDHSFITVNFAGCPVVSILDLNTNLVLKSEIKGFRGGTMNKNLPDTAGETDSIPALDTCHRATKT